MSHNRQHSISDTTAAKTSDHAAGSLPDLVQNLVKNWEIEASFKTNLSEWRTINPDEYSFSINGRKAQTGQDMLRTGTYNAIIQPGNEYYSPEHSTFAQSHKTFKRMMPTFAWEVLDVVGAPPVVGIKWRHWGIMKDDYVGFNDKGEKVTAKSHGGPIELMGTTWAWVDDQIRVKKLETWFDPLEMFRQIAPSGIVNRETVYPEDDSIVVPEKRKGEETDMPNQAATLPVEALADHAAGDVQPTIITNDSDRADDTNVVNPDCTLHSPLSTLLDDHLSPNSQTTSQATAAVAPGHPANQQESIKAALNETEMEGVNGHKQDITLDTTALVSVHDGLSTVEQADSSNNTTAMDGAAPAFPSSARTGKAVDMSHSENGVCGIMDTRADIEEGSAVAVPCNDARTRQAHAEMSKLTPLQCPFMNKE